jgi:hypothetical protein
MSGPDGSVLPVDPVTDSAAERARLAALDTFAERRFGMFVHWGLYSLAARHEWMRQRERMPRAEYRRYADYFDPDLYDPDLWAQAAAGAGMRSLAKRQASAASVEASSAVRWLAMRAALTAAGAGVRPLHRNYHIPISNTATAVMALEVT